MTSTGVVNVRRKKNKKTGRSTSKSVLCYSITTWEDDENYDTYAILLTESSKIFVLFL